MCISSFRSLFFPFPVLFPSPSFHRFFVSLSIHMPLSTPSSFTLSLSFRLVHFSLTPSFIITDHLCLILHILPPSPSLLLSLFSKGKQQTKMESRFISLTWKYDTDYICYLRWVVHSSISFTLLLLSFFVPQAFEKKNAFLCHINWREWVSILISLFPSLPDVISLFFSIDSFQ